MQGRLSFDQRSRQWVIDGVPGHVSLRLKGMFRQIREGSRPPFTLSDRPDLAADLEWFMQRYPLDMDAASSARLADSARAYRDGLARLEGIKRPDWTPPLDTGFRPGEAPEPYQQRAAEMLGATGRLLLLDDVGLGKTVSALAFLARGDALPAAVVVQPNLSTQWVKDYIKRFTSLTAYEVKDRNARTLPAADIYLFRYSNVSAWVDVVPTLGLRTVVFDEVQELRRGHATEKGRGSAALADAAEFRLGLTATPIYNYGSEIWNVVEFIAPGALGSWHEFVINWCHAHGTHWVVTDPEALGAYLQDEGIALRRTSASAEVSRTLPPMVKSVVEVDWCEEDAESDRELQMRLAQRVLSGAFHERGQAARELDLMLRQETGIAKARAAAAYARMLVEDGEPVLLVGWHREVYAIWNRMLADLRPVMFTGSESAAGKRRAAEDFAAGRSDLMIMSLRSGAGLDGLQHRAAHVVYGELDWSPQVHAQVTGRLHRRGQSRPVTAHYLHVDGGSDPVLIETLGLKASQSDGILNPYGGAGPATPVDDTRMRRLAKAVLGEKDVVPLQPPASASPAQRRGGEHKPQTEPSDD